LYITEGYELSKTLLEEKECNKAARNSGRACEQIKQKLIQMSGTLMQNMTLITEVQIQLSDMFDSVKSHSFIFLLFPLQHRTSVNASFHFSFLIFRQSVGLLGRGISPSQGRYLHRTTQTRNERRQTSMPRVGFEPTTPGVKRAKIVYASVRAATVFGQEIAKEVNSVFHVKGKIVSGSYILFGSSER
jgi:hypothetical protein